MDIKSIQASQIAPAMLHSPDGSSPKTGLSPESSIRVSPGSSASTNAAQTSIVRAQALVNRIDYVKEQLNKILVDWPPFFPPGTYQRVDLIRGIRGIQDEVEKSSVPSTMKEDVASRKLTENATDHEISAALDKLSSFRDEIAKNIHGTAENIEPGTMVSIRV